MGRGGEGGGRGNNGKREPDYFMISAGKSGGRGMAHTNKNTDFCIETTVWLHRNKNLLGNNLIQHTLAMCQLCTRRLCNITHRSRKQAVVIYTELAIARSSHMHSELVMPLQQVEDEAGLVAAGVWQAISPAQAEPLNHDADVHVRENMLAVEWSALAYLGLTQVLGPALHCGVLLTNIE